MKRFFVFILFLLLYSCGGINLNRVKGVKGKYYPIIEGNNVTFRVYAPHADVVNIMANFNGWNAYATPMKKGKDGVWRVKLTLVPGRKYYYKYVIDGYIVADPDNPRTVPDGYGGVNSVIIIEKGGSK